VSWRWSGLFSGEKRGAERLILRSIGRRSGRRCADPSVGGCWCAGRGAGDDDCVQPGGRRPVHFVRNRSALPAGGAGPVPSSPLFAHGHYACYDSLLTTSGWGLSSRFAPGLSTRDSDDRPVRAGLGGRGSGWLAAWGPPTQAHGVAAAASVPGLDRALTREHPVRVTLLAAASWAVRYVYLFTRPGGVSRARGFMGAFLERTLRATGPCQSPVAGFSDDLRHACENLAPLVHHDGPGPFRDARRLPDVLPLALGLVRASCRLRTDGSACWGGWPLDLLAGAAGAAAHRRATTRASFCGVGWPPRVVASLGAACDVAFPALDGPGRGRSSSFDREGALSIGPVHAGAVCRTTSAVAASPALRHIAWSRRTTGFALSSARTLDWLTRTTGPGA